MDDTLKDILQTLAANGHPLDVTVVTGTQYRDCTFIQQNTSSSASASAADPSAADPSADAPASGTAPTSAPPTLTLDERIAAAIMEVMELKDEKSGDYLFRYGSQWQGIYRILADRAVVRPRDYKGFGDYITAICPAPLRIPPAAKALTKTDSGLLAKPFGEWTPSRFDGNRTTYQRYALIAQAFSERLAALDGSAARPPG